jgi:hypothetical protein
MRFVSRVLVGVCAGLMLGVSALPASAAEWFVSPQGSDATGDGSLGKPLRTLGHLLDPARELVRAGDTVTLRGPVGANVFDETEVRVRVPLTLRSYEGEWAVIRCPIDLADGVCIQVDPDASGSRLSRLEVTGGNLYGMFFQTDWDSGNNRQGRGASNVIVEDCRIHDTGRDAIKITPKSDDITIRRCEIYNTGRIYAPGTPLDEKNAEGIDNVNGSRMLVEDSHIHDIATNGLYFKGGAADVVVQRNRIERVGEGGIMVGYDTSPEFFDTGAESELLREHARHRAQQRGARHRLRGHRPVCGARRGRGEQHHGQHRCVRSRGAVLRCHAAGLRSDRQAARLSINPLIRNNLVIQSGGYCGGIRWANEITAAGVYALQGSPGTDYNWYHDTTGECRFFDNRPGSALADGGTLAQWRSSLGSDAHSGSGAVTVTADGHLPLGSPVIDQGVTLPQVGDDMDGQARQAPVDIGADEYAAASTDADRVMNWAEAVYAPYFPKGAQAGTYLQYRYRYYPSTGNYLGTDGTRMVVHNGRDWNLLDVGRWPTSWRWRRRRATDAA